MFRLEQKHSRNLGKGAAPANAERLIAEQSVRAAVTGSVIAIACFNVIWAYTASASGRFFPWMSIIQGIVIGLVVQRAGRGLDWRFPLVAGVAAWVAAFSGGLFIALVFTEAETGGIGADWWQILQGFVANTVTVIDVIYALCAAAVATFFSKRRLSRHEVLALRNYAQGKK
ncbi:MAG: hypothetical protein ACE5FV_11040 [Woeseia sp.]